MDAIAYTKARATLAQTIDSACENYEPVIITKKNDRSVVTLSLEDYQALEESSHLIRNLHIPRSFGHPIHAHSATDSTLIRPPIPAAFGR
jgi:prevent-host-death family protein